MTESLDNIIDHASRSGDEPLSWQELGDLVRQADGMRAWNDRYPNLRSVVAEIAKRQNTKENLVWRAYSALRAFDEMSWEFAGLGIHLPKTVHDLPRRVTFETVELLERLRRAAPQEVWTRVAKNILVPDLEPKKRISRKALRDIVKAHMPALEGRTARGRGRDRPERPHGMVLEQDIAAALAKDGAQLLCASSEDKFRFYRERDDQPLDLICLAQPEGNDVQLHGIEVKTLVHPEALKRLGCQLADIRETFDAVWLATIETGHVLEQSSEITGLGIITYMGGELRVRRRPEISSDPNAKKEALLRSLFFERPMI